MTRRRFGARHPRGMFLASLWGVGVNVASVVVVGLRGDVLAVWFLVLAAVCGWSAWFWWRTRPARVWRGVSAFSLVPLELDGGDSEPTDVR